MFVIHMKEEMKSHKIVFINTFCFILIRCTLVSVMSCYSVTSHAHILDGSEVQFSGLVTDYAPKWTWQISSPDQSWSVYAANAKKKGEQLIFDLQDRGTLPFLEGHLQEVAERGGSGLTPVITFSSSGQPLAVVDGINPDDQRYRASVPVRNSDNGHVVGQLVFILEQGMAISTGHQEDGALVPAGMSLVSGQGGSVVQNGRLSQGMMSRLSALLLMNGGFGQGMSTSYSGQVISKEVLADERVTNLAAAYSSALSEFELYLPAEGTPTRWQAGLTVTVTVQ